MSIWVVTAKNPKTWESVEWYFDDMYEAGRAHVLTITKQGDAKIRKDYISSFDEFENWIEGRT